MIPEPNPRKPQPSPPSNQIEQEVNQNQGLIIGKVENGQAISINSITFQPNGSSSYQTSPSQFKKEVPHLLPYLANRKEQEAQLRDEFYHFLKQNSPSHLVCIIHGDEYQCHDSFLHRMQEFSLPKWIKLESEQPIIHKRHLEWPTKFKNSDDLLKQLEKNLAESILNDISYCSEKINNFFTTYPNPFIIHTHLLAENLHQQGCESLSIFLHFCQRLHKEITQQKLIICIFIKYKCKKHEKNLWAKWIFNFLSVFSKKYRYQRINKRVRQYLQALDISCFQPLSVIVLPELEGVNRGDVENWVRSQETKNFVGEAMIETLIQKVGEMFESWEEETSSDTIPMAELAKRLKSLIAVQGESA